MDQVLLPAIYKHHIGSQTQHYPSSFHHSLSNSTARFTEAYTQKLEPIPRQQLLSYFIQPDSLDTLWETILNTVNQAGLQQFHGLQLVLEAKNLKGLTKDVTWKKMTERFQQYWSTAVNSSYFTTARLFYDIGKEICPTQSYLKDQDMGTLPAEILLWKRCCLESYATSMTPKVEKFNKVQYYPTAMLADTAAVTIETSPGSPQRVAGLLYSQLYNSVKEVFAAGDCYPFTNARIESLALDPQLQQTWQHIGASLSHSPIALMKAYLYTKLRCQHAIEGSMQKSFGIHEEYRTTGALFNDVEEELKRQNMYDTEITTSMENRPYYIQLSSTVLHWY